jgi:ribA/ribD-fused uncharacterized protein
MRSTTHTKTNLKQTPSVCELYAGLAVMSTILKTMGWTIAMLCESQPHLRLLLNRKFPEADVLPDMDHNPGEQWASEGRRATLVVAGVSCQPFSEAGLKLGGLDKRSDDAFKVLTTAVLLEAEYILLENVPQYVDDDHSHQVFTRVCGAYADAGYALHSTTVRTHSESGGWTSRVRIFILFARDLNALPPSIPNPVTNGALPSLLGDSRCNWLTHGTLSPYTHATPAGGLRPTGYLQLGDNSISEGSVVVIPGSESHWRVQKIRNKTLYVRNVDRRVGGPNVAVECASVRLHLRSRDSRYTVYGPAGALPMVRASGEPPGMGAPLILVAPDDVRTLSTDDRRQLQEVDTLDVRFLDELGCSQHCIWSALGNTIPASMVLGNLQHLTKALVAPQRHQVAKRAKRNTACTYFFEDDDPLTGFLSQWYPCMFTDQHNVTYICAEQYMMAEKARAHGQMKVHLQVMTSASPAAMKAAGRAMPGYNERLWSTLRAEVLRTGNTLKFAQNPLLRDKLLATGQLTLAEASPRDKICGIGISLSDARAGAAWDGLNLLGIALMEVRALLARPTGDGTPPPHEGCLRHGPGPGTRRIVVIPVLAKTTEVALYSPSGSLFTDKRSSDCGTGQVLRHTTHLIGKWAEKSTLALAGHCDIGSRTFSVVTAVITDAALLPNGLRLYTLSDLAGSPAALPASMALATTLSHAGGTLTLEKLAPIATDCGARMGASAPKRLRATLINRDVTAAPPDFTMVMQALEDNLRTELQLAQDGALLAGDVGLAHYLSEWKQQVSTFDLDGVSKTMLGALPVFNDARLASLTFTQCSDLPETKPLPPVQEQTPTPGFSPATEQDILTPEAIRRLDAADAAMQAYSLLQATPGVTDDQLKRARPRAVFLGQDAFLPAAKGKIYDMTGPTPKLMAMNTDITTHLDRAYFRLKASVIPWVAHDQQLLQQVQFGVQSQTTLPLQFRHQPPLISLAAGVGNISAELVRLRALGYVQQHKRRPFLPMHLNPQGARAKKGTTKMRRISEMGAPRKAVEDTEGVDVEPFNVNAKYFDDGSLKLPQQVMPRPQDVMWDGAVLRYIGDRVGMPVVPWTDDLRDFFNQLKLHPSQLWMMCFPWTDLDDPTGSLHTIVETVVGFGHVFASNIAQRFSNAVTQIFLLEFDKMDAPFFEQDCARHPQLRAWAQHRAKLKGHTPRYNQARPLTFGFYCDDLISMALGAARAVRAKETWYRVTRGLNLLTAEPRKRIAGMRLPWTGLEYMPMAGLVLIPEDKTTAALMVLATAEAGSCEVGTSYRPLLGLIQFLRHVLRLPRTTVSWMLEPLRSGFEIDNGPSTWVRPTPQRVAQWREWRRRLMGAHCVSFAAILPETPEPPMSTRAVVWHGDAALVGTTAPAMCGYCHGLYWIFPLRARHKQLTIAALEFLTVLGNFIMFAPMYTTDVPTPKEDMVLLLQCDSLVSTHILSNDAAKDRVLLYIHMLLLARPELALLAETVVVGHQWGERNFASDHGSRGREDELIAACASMHIKAQRVHVARAFAQAVEETVAFATNPPTNEQTRVSADRK